MEPLIRAVRRTIDSMDERRQAPDSWLPSDEVNAWHYMAGALTAFLPQELQLELVESVQMMVAKAEDRRSDAPPEAWANQAQADGRRPMFEAVALRSYDPETDTLS